METLLKNLPQQELLTLLENFYEQENNDIVIACAHDVKNPLGIIELSLGLLEDKLSPILEGQDQIKSQKILGLINNINIALGRCEKTLDSTISLRKSSANIIKEDFSLKEFVNDYYYFLKPALKKSNINYENTCNEEHIVNLAKETLIKPFYNSLLYICEHVSAQTPMLLKIYSSLDSIFFDIEAKDGMKAIKLESSQATQQLVSRRLNLELEKESMTFTINQEKNKVLAQLKFI